MKEKLYTNCKPILWKNFSNYFLKVVRSISRSLEMLVKFSEKLLHIHHIIPIGSCLQISPTIPRKFREKFSLMYTKLFKIRKKFLEFSHDIFKLSTKIYMEYYLSLNLNVRQMIQNVVEFFSKFFCTFLMLCGKFFTIFLIFLTNYSKFWIVLS